MNKAGSVFEIHQTFNITGRGIVLTGFILNGDFRLGDIIKFDFNGDLISRKIKGFDNGMRVEKGKPNVGILIECKNQKEIEALRNWRPNRTMAEIRSDW
ncbi:hypothetical protein [Spongiimicrobium sp. 2-473A-2-J]|uniref:hypothetical protein n=1 Tax=Eudoraea algarum TaxID=3417568 RepID=UPI003D36DEBA